ncbi:hypothetical protein BDN70DRAFT_896658 [Pholiota conissans]|uniref:Uncharacterized protein n=1 Tax=Pholiota conissans TaxID=109636 RepID=A0A9P6CYG8_9AGAR|nr:hypothetical protein BDN70DRAFT_896658 [Pholiota conissans]
MTTSMSPPVLLGSSSPPTAPTTAPPPPPPIDLKHMTSSTALVSPGHRRASQHLRTGDPRVGSSASSIPSSPTSVHSSSSAIFERDIEPLVPPSPPHHAFSPTSPHTYQPPNPHRIPRARGSESLEQSVPSVLDSAAAILGSLPGDADALAIGEQVAVVAPAPTGAQFDFAGGAGGGFSGSVGGRTSGFASPIGSFRSRSPSPSGNKISAAELLLSIPQASIESNPTSTSSSPSNSQSRSRPVIRTTDTANTVTQVGSSDNSVVAGDEMSITSPSAPSPLASPRSQASPLSASHPPSPTLHSATKRLSFMSYADLRASTPAQLTTLSSLTTAAGTEPPPHIPGVSGLNGLASPSASASRAGSIRNVSLTPAMGLGLNLNALGLGPTGGITHPGMKDSIALLDNVGGEWERQGLGTGMEERLEALAGVGSSVGSPEGVHAVEPAVPAVIGGKA